MQSRTSAAISASVSGVKTRNGSSTRQSVASVTCATREKASKRMLSCARVLEKQAPRALAHLLEFREAPLEARYRLAGGAQQLSDLGVAHGVGRIAALFQFAQAMVQRLDELPPPLRIVEQVVLQVGIAVDDPDVAEDLVQHARRAAGAPFGAQIIEHRPGGLAQQADDDFAVGERGVVVGDFPQTRFRLAFLETARPAREYLKQRS